MRIKQNNIFGVACLFCTVIFGIYILQKKLKSESISAKSIFFLMYRLLINSDDEKITNTHFPKMDEQLMYSEDSKSLVAKLASTSDLLYNY